MQAIPGHAEALIVLFSLLGSEWPTESENTDLRQLQQQISASMNAMLQARLERDTESGSVGFRLLVRNPAVPALLSGHFAFPKAILNA